MDNLEPCPFCGESENLKMEVESEEDAEYFCISCDCGANGPGCTGEVEAIDGWNERVE